MSIMVASGRGTLTEGKPAFDAAVGRAAPRH
jgi:hypothetical protein